MLQLGFVAVVNLFCSPLLLFSSSRPSFVLDGMSISITRNFDKCCFKWKVWLYVRVYYVCMYMTVCVCACMCP